MVNSPAVITCPSCGAGWPPETFNTGHAEPCPQCAQPAEVFAFPALYRPMENATAAAVAPPGDAACFYHAGKLAVSACEACGRFLCGLCDIEFNGRHLCAPCLEAEKKRGPTHTLQPRYMQFDSLALALAAGPVVLFPFWCLSIFTAPVALFLVVRYWRQPMSVLPRTRWRFVVAFLFALAVVIGWGVLIVMASRDLFNTSTGGGGG